MRMKLALSNRTNVKLIENINKHESNQTIEIIWGNKMKNWTIKSGIFCLSLI